MARVDTSRFSETQQRKVARVLEEFKAGTLRSSSGNVVRSRKQAVAIALDKARRMGH